jgi:RNA polymerase sigma-70 factor (ECF subfamily)
MPGWESLVREQGPMVFQTAWRLLRDVQEAEDVTQDVLLELYRSRRPEDVSPGLLQSIAVRRAIDHLRRRQRGVCVSHLALATQGPSPDAQVIEAELVEQLRAGIAQLPPRQAEVFCLRFLHEQTYQQIADALEISPQAVAVSLHQARAKLRSYLGEFAEEPRR